MLKIVCVPNPILTTPTIPVDKIDEKIKKLVAEMEETLVAQKDPEGVGLAAPQVGKNISLFIIKCAKNDPVEAFINPEILKTVSSPVKKAKKQKVKKETPLEGCLSIPRIWGPIRRNTRIFLKYQNLDGIWNTKWFSGFKAVVIEHEMDHLQGILFTQRALEQHHDIYEEQTEGFEKIEC